MEFTFAPMLARALSPTARLLRLTAPLSLLALLGCSASAASSPTWIESESIAAQVPNAGTGMPNAQLLSDDKALVLNFNKNEMEAKIPEGGLLLKYPFSVSKSGEHTLWNRVVFEKIRTPFEWRVDNGTWQLNSQAEQPITNVQELAFWNPIGWSRMGTASINSGKHTLEIRIARQYEDPETKQKPKAIHYQSDALIITQDNFRPNYRFQPGADFQNETDRAAAKQVYSIKADVNAPRQTLELTGLWQLAPYDEIDDFTEEQRVSGTDIYPNVNNLNWYGYNVPDDRNTQLPELRFAHRFVVRSAVEVPADFKGDSFQLTFESISMISSLFVNGKKVGDFGIAKGQWRVDVSEFIQPGKKNEILLVIKDSYYAISADAKNLKKQNLRRIQYLPESMFASNQGTTWRFDFPAANGHGQTGFIDIVKLDITKGSAYVQDTFIKPLPITKGVIDIDTTVLNPSSHALNGAIKQQIRTWPEGKKVADLPSKKFQISAKQSTTLNTSTPSNPLTLWWINDATLYELMTDVVANGKTIDRTVTRFGNREWEVRGTQLYLNGVAQHLRADTSRHHATGGTETAGPAFEHWREMGINMIRRRFQERWFGMSQREILNRADEEGMPVRQACTVLDGQVASYRFITDKDGKRTVRHELMDRWREQALNGVIARRNNPSVFIWELDNEAVYINARNFGWSELVEPEWTKTSNAVIALDPTRTTVIGGGGALLDESLPTYGVHYFEVADRHYPNEAYTSEVSLAREGTGDAGRIWPIRADTKPLFMSETAFLPGRSPSGFAAAGGEITFLGKRQSRAAAGKIATWLAEGYRWQNYAGVHFWIGEDFTDGSYIDVWQPVAILRRHWKDTYGSGESVQRELRVYNDEPNTAPLAATWSVELDGKSVLDGKKTFQVAPGTFEPWDVHFTMPKTKARQIGFFNLTISRDGEQIFARAIPIELVPESKQKPAKIDGDLIVWDSDGATLKRLQANGYKVSKSISSLAEVPDSFGLLVVGKNTLTASDSTNRRWMKLTATGNRIVFFEQNHPVHFQAVSADYEPTEFDGTIAFSQDLTHPIFNGVTQNDLDFWGSDEVVYRHALRKATKGAVSLVQVDDALAYSALSTIAMDDGLNVVSQLAIAEKLDEEATARRLFDNIIAYAATYERVVRPTFFVANDAFLKNSINALGVDATNGTDPVAVLKANPGCVLVVEGSAANLEALAAQPKLLKKNNEAGGWIIVMNVTPESLPAFNKIVEYDHVIREFRQERVRFPAVPDPLTSGLTQRDVVMSSGRRIQAYTRDEWPTDDAFDYVLDLTDIAPFAEFPSPAHWNDPDTKGPGNDTWPLNMVNGYGRDTHWRMIFSIHLNNGDPTKWTLKLPQPEKVKELRIAPNAIYHRIKAYEITFDGDASTTQRFEVDPMEELQVLTIENPVTSSEIEINITDWLEAGTADVIGIDNMEIVVERPSTFDEQVRPMLNIGGLIKYPRANGGIVLFQYVFREIESNPVNFDKKKTVLAALLRNLGSPFGGKSTPIAGFNLRYAPISLEQYANLYLTKAQGWPTHKGDLSALPRGENTFAGVRYLIRDFSTSPLESAVTLKHPQLKSNASSDKITGIPFGHASDSLFFLQTFIQTRQWKLNHRKTNEPPVLFTYTVHYEDKTQEVVEVTLYSNVDNWLQDTPKALPEAALAWIGNVEGSEQKAAVYQMQWNNPHPEKVISSIDLSYGKDGSKWGAPVLLGITAARVQE